MTSSLKRSSGSGTEPTIAPAATGSPAAGRSAKRFDAETLAGLARPSAMKAIAVRYALGSLGAIVGGDVAADCR